MFVQTQQRQGQTALRASYFANQKKSQKAQKQMRKKLQQTEDTKKKKANVIEMDGTVLMHSRNIFKVSLSNGAEVSCTLAGKLRMNSIRVLEGDKVTVEMSPFDLTRGRITFRFIDSSLLESEEDKKKREKEEAKEAAKAARRQAKSGGGDGN